MRSDAIPRGRYYVAVNAQLGPSLSAPFAPTYSPGVTALDDAQAIELRDGERKTDVAIVVRPLKETTVSGIVVTEAINRLLMLR